jgi:hypothetical protein
MIRIGCSRWLVRVVRQVHPGDYLSCFVGMYPEAGRYRILHGSSSEPPVELDIVPQPVEVSALLDRRDIAMNGGVELDQWGRLAREISLAVVDECQSCNLLGYEAFTKAATVCVLHAMVVRHLQEGTSDGQDQVEFIDLAQQMREIIEQRERQQREEMARRAADNMRRVEGRNRANKTSFELLYSFLSEGEKEEICATGRVTVRNKRGTFVVPATDHGLVDQYVDGTYKASYCVMFEDRTIPIGDVVLMKVALLKADPDLFMSTANKFNYARDRHLAVT